MSVISSIEIARAASFKEHPTEAKPIVFTNNKISAESTVLTPQISFVGAEVNPLAVLVEGQYAFFEGSTAADLTNPSAPYTQAVPAYLFRAFDYYKYPKENNIYPISVVYSDSDTYHFTVTNPNTGAVSTTNVPVNTYLLLQTTGTKYYRGDNVWTTTCELVMYKQNPDTGIWSKHGLLLQDTMYIDGTGVNQPVRYISADNTISART